MKYIIIQFVGIAIMLGSILFPLLVERHQKPLPDSDTVILRDGNLTGGRVKGPGPWHVVPVGLGSRPYAARSGNAPQIIKTYWLDDNGVQWASRWPFGEPYRVGNEPLSPKSEELLQAAVQSIKEMEQSGLLVGSTRDIDIARLCP